VASYRGHPVPLLKRAQIAAADLHGAGLAAFPDLAALTCFADYKLPQVLRHHGALEYAERLAPVVDDRREIPPCDPVEVEIRAATVVAVDRLAAAAGRRAFEMDWILWDLAQTLRGMRPYHRVRTVFY